MKNSILILLLVVMSSIGQIGGTRAYGQQTNTIYQFLPNKTVVAGSYQSGIINNIGQSGHYLSVTFDSLCTNPIVAGGFTYSYDNSIGSYNLFGQQFVKATTPLPVLYASGAFPYVQASFTFSPTSCIPTVNYSGVVTGSITTVQGITPINTNASTGSPYQAPYPVVGGYIQANVSVNGNANTYGVVAANVEGATKLM